LERIVKLSKLEAYKIHFVEICFQYFIYKIYGKNHKKYVKARKLYYCILQTLNTLLELSKIECTSEYLSKTLKHIFADKVKYKIQTNSKHMY